MVKQTLSPKECAAYLGLSLPLMYELCRRADFPSIRVSPRRIVIPAAALNSWLEAQAFHKSNT